MSCDLKCRESPCVFWGDPNPKSAFDSLGGFLGGKEFVVRNDFVIAKSGSFGDEFITVTFSDGFQAFQAEKIWHLFSPDEYRFRRWSQNGQDGPGWIDMPLGIELFASDHPEPHFSNFAKLFALGISKACCLCG